MKQNEHQLEEAKVLATQLGVDSLVFKKVDFPHGEDDTAEAERWLPREHPEYLRKDPFYKPYSEDGQVCWSLWRTAVINWDGGFVPCCYLTDKTEDFGDLNLSSVKEVWNNSSYTTARSLFNDKFVPGEWVGCLDCSVYQGSAAAQWRGPVDLHQEPVVLQINGSRPATKNGAVKTDESGVVEYGMGHPGDKIEKPSQNNLSDARANCIWTPLGFSATI